jgi:hypothetical protein
MAATPPDVIPGQSGQNHSQTVEALLRCTPPIFVFHSPTSCLDEPFYFPRILR